MAQVTMEAPWLSDNLTEAIKADSNFIDKCQYIAADIQGNNMKLVTLVERLGAILTDTDPEIRARGTQILSQVLQNLPKDFLQETELKYIAAFFVGRLVDHHSIVPAVLQGILAVAQMTNIPSDMPVNVVHNVFRHIQCQTMKPEDRRCIYKIFELYIHNYTNDLKALGSDFVYGFMSVIDQEKDARNLLIVFGMLPFFIKTFPLGHLKEDMFEIISCYFPVDYRSEYSKSPVTRDNLADALQVCLTASSDFAEFCLPLVIEKLDSKLKQAKLDSFKVLIAGCEVFSVESIRVFMLDIWRTIHHEVLPGSDKDVRELGLEALKAIVRTMSLAAVDKQGTRALSSITTFVLNAGLNSLTEVQLNLFLPAVRMMLTVAEASSASCCEVCKKVIPILIQQYHKESGTEQKVTVLRSLSSFIAVCISQNVTPTESSDIAPLWVDVPALLLEAAQSEHTEIRKEGFHGLAVAAPLLPKNNRDVLYELLCKGLRQEGQGGVRAEILKCLKEAAKIHTDEVMVKIVTRKMNDVESLVSSSEDMLLTLDALCEIATSQPFTSVIVPYILTLITDSFSPEKCAIAMKCLRKLLESSVGSESQIYKYVYTEYGIVARLVQWWLHGVVSDKSVEIFESEDMLLNTAAILDIVMKNQAIEIQEEVVCTFVPHFVNPNPCKAEVPNFKPLESCSPWKHTQLIVILEALVGSLHKDVRIPLHEEVVKKLTRLAIRTTHEVTHHSACRLTANLINKDADGDCLMKLLEEISQECVTAAHDDSASAESQEHAVGLLVWVTKALLMRGHVQLDHWVESLLALLAHPRWGMQAAQGFSVIMKQDVEYLNNSNFCNIRILYRQRFFSITPKLVEAFRSANDEIKANYLVALGHILQGVPREVLLMDLEAMVPLLVESLQQTDVLLLLTTLDTILSVLEESTVALQHHLQTFIPRILILTQFSDSMRVRMKALQCTYHFSKYPTELILPFKPKVLQVLGQCLDDAKRLVRKEAVVARTKWFVVGTSGYKR